MLSISNLNVHYGAIHAIRNVSLEVGDGEIVSLIGANGAGKTTILHTITGLKAATDGSIQYNGIDLRKIPPHQIVSQGLAHSPEGRHVFARMTVTENLQLGAYSRTDTVGIAERMDAVFKRFPRLKERHRQSAGTLSGGEQQMLAIGRALMSSPKLLLLDEPSMGLAPILVKEIFDIVQDVNQSGVTVLLVEQNAKMALSISHRAYVLETGKIRLSGEAASLMENDAVRKAYLGA